MSMRACGHCQEVNIEILIEGPDRFAQVLKVIRANLADGTIKESTYWPEGKIKSCETPFADVNATGPYQEDIFSYYFECPKCAQLFSLTCNTYHGRGGKWAPILG